MKENLKKMWKYYDNFLKETATNFWVIIAIMIFTFPFRTKISKLNERVEQLEEQIKVIEVQKYETNN